MRGLRRLFPQVLWWDFWNAPQMKSMPPVSVKVFFISRDKRKRTEPRKIEQPQQQPNTAGLGLFTKSKLWITFKERYRCVTRTSFIFWHLHGDDDKDNPTQKVWDRYKLQWKETTVQCVRCKVQLASHDRTTSMLQHFNCKPPVHASTATPSVHTRHKVMLTLAWPLIDVIMATCNG